MSAAIFVGIDIAKADFVVACRPDATSWTATNDPEGIVVTVDRLSALAPCLIVLEATGGYETALVAACTFDLGGDWAHRSRRRPSTSVAL